MRVNLDLYDTNEALLAKVQAGNVGYDVALPLELLVEILLAQGLLRPLDHSALPHLRNVDPALPRPRLRPRQPLLGALLLGHGGHRLPRRAQAGAVDSWAALWDPRYRGRILMLDDAREALGAALKRRGRSLNATDPRAAGAAPSSCSSQQKPLVRAYNSVELRGRAALRRRVAGAGVERPVRQGDGAGPGHRLRDPARRARACSSTAS